MRAYWAAACCEVARPDVQVAQQLGRGPVAGLFLHQAGVLGDGRVQATLAQQLLGSPEGLVAVHRPGWSGCGRRLAARRDLIKQRRGPERAAVMGRVAEACRPRPGARAWRSPCAGRSRTGHPARAARPSAGRGGPWRRSRRRRSTRRGGRRGRCRAGRRAARECVNASTRTTSGRGARGHHGAPHGLAATRGESRSDRCPPAPPRRRPRPARGVRMRSARRSRSAGGTSFESARPADGAIGVEDDRAGHDRAGEAAAADLVDAGHVDEADPPEGLFDQPRGLDPCHGCTCRPTRRYAGRLASFMRAALPFSSRRK